MVPELVMVPPYRRILLAIGADSVKVLRLIQLLVSAPKKEALTSNSAVSPLPGALPGAVTLDQLVGAYQSCELPPIQTNVLPAHARAGSNSKPNATARPKRVFNDVIVICLRTRALESTAYASVPISGQSCAR